MPPAPPAEQVGEIALVVQIAAYVSDTAERLGVPNTFAANPYHAYVLMCAADRQPQTASTRDFRGPPH